jgi:hypothetical protein
MQIWNALEWKNKQKVIIKSIVWKTIIDIFKQEKNIDITSYLISVTIKWNIFFIKTKKPIINTELNTINEIIKNNLIEKFGKMWIKFYDFEIKYI